MGRLMHDFTQKDAPYLWMDLPAHSKNSSSEMMGHLQGVMLWHQTSSGASCGCWPRRSRSLPPWVTLQHQVGRLTTPLCPTTALLLKSALWSYDHQPALLAQS